MRARLDTIADKRAIESIASGKVWLIAYAAVVGACIVFLILISFHVIPMAPVYLDAARKAGMALCLGSLILFASKSIEIIILRRSGSKYGRYNLVRVIHLLSIIAVAFVFISFLFKNWYAAAVSLGLISLILGFALQTPISSFIGWIYIIIRNPYHIGDRIQIDTFKGDVVKIGYTDTTLWEFAGEYLTNDLPSGRLITFPNSLVLESAVFNYSWRDFEFIWNEIPFHIAYESDFAFVEQTIKQVTVKELGPEAAEDIRDLKQFIKDSPISDVDVKEYPFVSFRTNANTWVEVTVTYLVPPKQATGLRSRIIKNVVAALLKEPDKVLFPKSNMR